MKLPAIRSKMGDWVYYIATMTMEEIDTRVKKIDEELHKSKTLSELLQRSITDNYKNIADYLVTQDERFFNSLVLAVYDGDPQWQEIRLDFNEEEYFYDIGFIDFSGEEKIFPIDGQHRVEGIKKAIRDKPDLRNDRVPVILLSHNISDKGMKRSRRLFSTLNRYAKPVTLGDIIALDEDDAVAICTRRLIEEYPLFSKDKVLVSGSKAMPKTNVSSFTNVITLYECNSLISEIYLNSIDVYDNEGARVIGKKKKSNIFFRFRPNDLQLDELYSLLKCYWDSLNKHFENIKLVSTDKKDSIISNRNNNGGSLLFRPIGLSEFSKTVKTICILKDIKLDVVVEKLSQLQYSMDSSLWNKVVWDNYGKIMIPSNKILISKILLHLYNDDVLIHRSRENMLEKLVTAYGFVDSKESENHLKKYMLNTNCE